MMTETELLNTTDAQLWAQDFMARFGGPERCSFIDEGLMIGWFANAIEVGRSQGRKETLDALEALEDEIPEIADDAPVDPLSRAANNYLNAVSRAWSNVIEGFTNALDAKALGIQAQLDRAEGIDDGPLTPDEHRLLDLLGEVANQFQVVLNASEEEGYTGNSAVRDHDWNEVAIEIHHLQARVMAQAAARSYPDRYRRLGATIPSS